MFEVEQANNRSWKTMGYFYENNSVFLAFDTVFLCKRMLTVSLDSNSLTVLGSVTFKSSLISYLATSLEK